MVFNIPAAGGAVTGKGAAASSPSVEEARMFSMSAAGAGVGKGTMVSSPSSKLMRNSLGSTSLTPPSGDLSSAPISELDMEQVEQIVHDQLSRSVELQQQPGSSPTLPPCGADMSMELDPAG